MRTDLYFERFRNNDYVLQIIIHNDYVLQNPLNSLLNLELKLVHEFCGTVVDIVPSTMPL